MTDPVRTIAERVRTRVLREGVDLGTDSGVATRFAHEEVRRYSERALAGAHAQLADEVGTARDVVAAITGASVGVAKRGRKGVGRGKSVADLDKLGAENLKGLSDLERHRLVWSGRPEFAEERALAVREIDQSLFDALPADAKDPCICFGPGVRRGCRPGHCGKPLPMAESEVRRVP